jgi:metal-responsive CopG/Arc/MetJ family transcriptional regulator
MAHTKAETQVNLRMDVDLLNRIDDYADATYRNRSQAIRLLLTEALDAKQESDEEK